MIVFVTLEDLSRTDGGGVATREIVAGLGRVSSEPLAVICPKPVDEYSDRVSEQVDEFRYLPPAKGSGQLQWHARAEWRTFLYLRRLQHEEQLSLVVTRMTPSTLSPAPYCQLIKVPHILLVRGWVTRDRASDDSLLGPLIEQLIRMNTRLSTHVYVAFEELRQRLARYRNSRQTPVSVLPNAVDADLFTPRDGQAIRDQLNVPRDDFVVGFVGTFSDRHQLPTLLEAGAMTDDTHLLLVGDGPRRSELEAFATELGIDGEVTFTGRVHHENVPRYISACDVGYGVVHPESPSNPIKCYEYLACERPVLTSDRPEFEFVAEVDAGMTLESITPETVADTLATLRDKSNEERKKMGKSGREYVVEHHTWDRVASILLESAT